MADTPHWYVVRSAGNGDEYQRLFDRITEAGVWEEWRGRRYKYWYPGDGFKYWQMGKIINRARA